MNVIWRRLPHGNGTQHPCRVVVHAMAYQIDHEGERLYAASFLERIGLSAHALVSMDGTVIRCRKDDEIAWHARGWNQDSLGIEVLVPGVYEYGAFVERIAKPWVPREQFDGVIGQIRQWQNLWDIREVVRHSDIDPERKVDPGYGFPWEALQRAIA